MAKDNPGLEIELVLADGTVQKAFAKINKQSKKTGKESGALFGNSFNSFLGNIGAIGFAKVMGEVKSIITGTVSAAQSLEVFETQFKTMLGSSILAKKQLKDLQEFAASTPFQIGGLSLATRQLLSFGVEQKKIIPTLRRLGDMAAGVGANIDELTIPYGRLISTQKLTLVELDKFADRGVNIYGQLSKQTGISLQNIRDEISKGKISFSEFTKALEAMTSEGGTFFKGMEAQSKTLSGVFSTLSDNVFNLQGTIGESFRPILIKLVTDLTDVVQKFTKYISTNSVGIAKSFVEIGRGINDYVVLPLTYLKDTAKLVFSGIVTGLNGVVSMIGNDVGVIADMANNIGIENNLTRGMQAFRDSSKEIFEESRKEFDELWNDPELFSTDFYESVAGYLSELEKVSLATKTTAEDIGKSLKEGFEKGAKATKVELTSLQKSIDKQLRQGVVNTVSQSMQYIGKSLVLGGLSFKGFLGVVLNSLGDMAISIGTTVIATDHAIQGMRAALSEPGAAIALGAGLIAVGAAMKAFGSQVSGEASASTQFSGSPALPSGGGSGSSEYDTSLDIISEDEKKNTAPIINLTVEGSVIGSEKEELALGIANLIKTAGIDGVTV